MSLASLSTAIPKDLSFADETYLVTGAANGIGRAIALALTKLHANVLLLDKDADELNSIYDEINAIGKGESVIVHQDLAELTQEHCKTLSTQIAQSFGSLDGLVHCAAETGQLAPIEHYSQDDWSKVIQANLHAPYLLTSSLMPLMLDQGEKTIIFTLSDQALKSSAFWGAYAVAQQGLKALIDTWTQETENNDINFIMLNPGKVNTEFLIRLFPGLNADNHPNAEIISRAYVYLLANHKKNMHGKFVQVRDLELEIVN